MNTWILATNEHIVNLVGVVAAIGGTTTVVAVAPSAPAIGGVDTIIHVPIAENTPAEAYAGVVAGLPADAKGGVIPATNRPAERSLVGAAAAVLALPAVAGAMSVSAESAEVTHCGGLTSEAIAFKDAVLILEGGTAPEAGSPAAQTYEGTPVGIAIIDAQSVGPNSANFAMARRTVSCGCRFKTEEDLDLVRILAKALGAEIVCSRPLTEDAAWLSRDRHAGVSGMHVAPGVYITLGISGQVQYTSGMADSRAVITVNNDVNAPIFRISDYSIVGDIYGVVPALTVAPSWNEKKDMPEKVDLDAVVIGGGVASTVCAYTLAEQGREVSFIERAVELGSKNLFGGVFYCRVMEKVFPNFVDVAPVECRITRSCVNLINASPFVNIDYWDQCLSESVNVVTMPCVKPDA